MKKCIIIIAFILFITTHASGSSNIQNMSKSEDKDSVQIFLSFDQIPRYETQLAGKRLDIILENTQMDEQAAIFEENDKIVKILVRPIKEDTELSFFFRYNPQDISFSISEKNTLVGDILLGNRFTRTYRDLSSSLEGLTVLERSTQDFANPLVVSPYAHDWKTFFSTYESDVSISAPVRFFIPDFPVTRLLKIDTIDVSDLIPDEISTLAEEQKWSDAIDVIEKSIISHTDIQSKKILALLYGEALLRDENFEGSYKQLYLLKENYHKEQIGQMASYLLSLLLAVNGDPYSANYELRLLVDRMNKSNPLFAYVNLLLTETFLATNQMKKMRVASARDDIAYPPILEKKRELRQADLFYATDQPVRAYVAYQLTSKDNNLEDHPYSLNGLCETLYKQKIYEEASSCYDQLAELTETREQLGMAYYRSMMAQLHEIDDISELINDFSRIEDAFPGTEAGFRAAVKKTDLRYISRKDWSGTAIKYYKALADKSMYREVSAESYFKEALLCHLSGNNTKAIELTNTLLRNFRTGPIRSHAEALLIQLIPGELKRLVEEEKFTHALAVARRHRKFFENNWLDLSILADLGYSYHQLGIYNDAMQLYLYLMGIASPEEKETYFLPLTQLAFDKGDYELVQDYATQYTYHYPEGTFKEEIRYLLLKSLLAENKIDQAIHLIPKQLPDRDDYKLLAAELLFRKDDYNGVVAILKPLLELNVPLLDSLTFILAESLYHLGDFPAAEKIYMKTREVDRYAGQSMYRLAEISRGSGLEKEAIQLYTTMSESDSETLWKKFAEREVKLKQLTENL